MDCPGRILVESRDFSSNCPNRLWAHPASYSLGAGMLSFAVKDPECNVDHLHPSSVEIMEYANTAAPPIFLHGVGRKKIRFSYPSAILISCETFTQTALWTRVAVV